MALIDNQIAYWKADESSGDAADATGNGKTLTNTGTVGYASAKINNGFDFGTANSSKRMGRTEVLLPGNSDMTLNYWINIRTAPGSGARYMTLVSMDNNTQIDFHIVYLNNAGTKQLEIQRYRRDQGPDPSLVVNQTLTPGTWYMLSMTYNATSHVVEGFLNGSSLGTATGSGLNGGSTNTADFRLAAWIGNSEWLSAYMDEVGLWSRVLSGAEITSLYNSGAGLQYPYSTFKPIFNKNAVNGAVMRAANY